MHCPDCRNLIRRGAEALQQDTIEFREQILPLLQQARVRDLANHTGLSKSYVSAVRLGTRTPSRRHWQPLRNAAQHLPQTNNRSLT